MQHNQINFQSKTNYKRQPFIVTSKIKQNKKNLIQEFPKNLIYESQTKNCFNKSIRDRISHTIAVDPLLGVPGTL